jgi:large subunit ribosomal protein L54
MICKTCLKRIRLSHGQQARSFITSVGRLNAAIPASRGTPSGGHEGPPAAVSTSAAQPFSTPMTPAPPIAKEKPASTKVSEINSIVPAGTVLKGLGYLKNKDPPVALEDHEYPSWLWSLLDTNNTSSKDSANPESDIYCKLLLLQ